MGDATDSDVAAWMLNQLKAEGELYQTDAVAAIETLFGTQFTIINASGNTAIAPSTLAAFRAITANSVVWERAGRYWRWREKHDDPHRRTS
jgi:hypothetical protein